MNYSQNCAHGSEKKLALLQHLICCNGPRSAKDTPGKIMRRILRKIAANEHSELGDTSTLADPSVVDDLIENRANR